MKRGQDHSGAKQGSEFLVNTQTANSQNDPTITGLADGGFVVTWTTYDASQDSSYSAFKAQVFDSGGAKTGAEFLVNSQTSDFQLAPSITALSDGGFVATWVTNDPTQDGSRNAIKAQVFDASGAKVGDEFLVNSEATGNQSLTTVAALEDGGFVVTWTTYDSA